MLANGRPNALAVRLLENLPDEESIQRRSENPAFGCPSPADVVGLGERLIADVRRALESQSEDIETCVRSMMCVALTFNVKARLRLSNEQLEKVLGTPGSGRVRQLQRGEHLPSDQSLRRRLGGRCEEAIRDFYKPLWLVLLLTHPLDAVWMKPFRHWMAKNLPVWAYLRALDRDLEGYVEGEDNPPYTGKQMLEGLECPDLLIALLRVSAAQNSVHTPFIAQSLYYGLLLFGCANANRGYVGLLFAFCERHVFTLPGCPLRVDAEDMARKSAMLYAVAALHFDPDPREPWIDLSSCARYCLGGHYGPEWQAIFSPSEAIETSKASLMLRDTLKAAQPPAANTASTSVEPQRPLIYKWKPFQPSDARLPIAQWAASLATTPHAPATWMGQLLRTDVPQLPVTVHAQRSIHRLGT